MTASKQRQMDELNEHLASAPIHPLTGQRMVWADGAWHHPGTPPLDELRHLGLQHVAAFAANQKKADQ